MAKFIADDVYVSVNGVDISEHVMSVTLNEASDEVDVTGMGASAKERLLGIADASIELEVFQDFAAGSVNATLRALRGSNTPFAVVVRPTSSAVGATNPSYTMQAVLPEFSTLDAKVGDASTTKVKFLNADPSGIVEATS